MPKQTKKSHFFIVMLVICISALMFTACSSNPTKDNMQDNAQEMRNDMKEAGKDMSSGEGLDRRDMNYVLYFANADRTALEKEERQRTVNDFTDKDTIDVKARFIVDQLIAGPKDKNLGRVLPADTRINACTLDKDGVLHLDLSEGLITGFKALNLDEKFTVNALAASLMQYPEIKKVKITVDKKSLKLNTKEYKDAVVVDESVLSK